MSSLSFIDQIHSQRGFSITPYYVSTHQFNPLNSNPVPNLRSHSRKCHPPPSSSLLRRSTIDDKSDNHSAPTTIARYTLRERHVCIHHSHHSSSKKWKGRKRSCRHSGPSFHTAYSKRHYHPLGIESSIYCTLRHTLRTFPSRRWIEDPH